MAGVAWQSASCVTTCWLLTGNVGVQRGGSMGWDGME